MTQPTRRVDRLPGGVGTLVDRVPDDAIGDCLRMLTVSAVDVADLGDRAPIATVLDQWRHGQPATTRATHDLSTLVTQFEFDSSVAHRAGDIDAQRVGFRRARAVMCLEYAVGGAGDSRRRLAETTYEAAMAMGGSAGVVAILAEYVP